MPVAAALPQSWSRHASLPVDFELDPPTPTQVREWVSDLFQNQHISLAVALAEAGLALYPDSEDVLVIAALVSEVQQDWLRARGLLEHLIKVQSGCTPAEVWLHLARVLRCEGNHQRSLTVARQALRQHPTSHELRQIILEVTATYPELQPDSVKP